jgi:hypothetical protein
MLMLTDRSNSATFIGYYRCHSCKNFIIANQKLRSSASADYYYPKDKKIPTKIPSISYLCTMNTINPCENFSALNASKNACLTHLKRVYQKKMRGSERTFSKKRHNRVSNACRRAWMRSKSNRVCALTRLNAAKMKHLTC